MMALVTLPLRYGIMPCRATPRSCLVNHGVFGGAKGSGRVHTSTPYLYGHGYITVLGASSPLGYHVGEKAAAIARKRLRLRIARPGRGEGGGRAYYTIPMMENPSLLLSPLPCSLGGGEGKRETSFPCWPCPDSRLRRASHRMVQEGAPRTTRYYPTTSSSKERREPGERLLKHTAGRHSATLIVQYVLSLICFRLRLRLFRFFFSSWRTSWHSSWA